MKVEKRRLAVALASHVLNFTFPFELSPFLCVFKTRDSIRALASPDGRGCFIPAVHVPGQAASLPAFRAAGLIQVKVVTLEFGIVSIQLARRARRGRTNKR